MKTELTSLSPRAARAHALKNCLAVVSAINRLLETELSERSRERMKRSQDAVKRMLALIQDDLASDRASVTYKRTFVLAEEILRAVVARVEDRAQAGGVELIVRAGPGGVVGNGAELAEALTNVVLNAIEATPPSGAVLVTTLELSDGSQVWAVQDTGPGIPEHLKDRVGLPFVTGRRGGSGLGLAVARQTFEQHGGQLHIRSIAGSGTLVSTRLPPSVEQPDRACAAL
jgi:two-component system, NtrC family, sensor histidine kinase HydH